MTKSSATSQIEGKNKTIDYKKLYQEQAKKHQLMLSQISHEIRNPVTLINSFLQILEKQHPDLSEDQTGLKSWKIWIFSEVCLVSFPVIIILSD